MKEEVYQMETRCEPWEQRMNSFDHLLDQLWIQKEGISRGEQSLETDRLTIMDSRGQPMEAVVLPSKMTLDPVERCKSYKTTFILREHLRETELQTGLLIREEDTSAKCRINHLLHNKSMSD